MEYMHELKDKLCDELEEIARKALKIAGDIDVFTNHNVILEKVD